MAQLAHYSVSTLSTAASGTKLPSLDVTLGYVRACGGDVEEWERRWQRVSAQISAAAGADKPAEEKDDGPAEGAAGAAVPEPMPGGGDGAEPTVAVPAGGVQADESTGLQARREGTQPLTLPGVGRFSRRPGLHPAGGGVNKALAVTTVAAVAAVVVAGGVIVSVMSATGKAPRVVAGPTVTVNASTGVSSTATMTVTTPPDAGKSGGGMPQVKGGSGKGAQSPGISHTQDAVVHTLLAGPGCPTSAAAQTSTYSGGDGWQSVDGGWSSNGCDGSARYTDQTGYPDITQDVFTWSFRVSGGMAARCWFAIYVADTYRSKGLAPYEVDDAGGHVADFTVGQDSLHGKWFSSATYTISGTALLKLADHGNGGWHTSVSASAVIAHCS